MTVAKLRKYKEKRDFSETPEPKTSKKNVKYKQNILAKKMKLNLQPLSDSFFIRNGIIAIPLKSRNKFAIIFL